MTIIVLSDSLGQGFHDTQAGGWVERLKTHLFKEGEDIVFNLSVSNFTTRDIITLINRGELEPRIKNGFGKPLIIILSIGSNDSGMLLKEGIEEPIVDIKDFGNNLRVIKSLLKERNANIIVMGLMKVDETRSLPVEWDKNLFYYNKRVEEYNRTLEYFSSENSLAFVKLHDKEPWLSDGVHWTPEVHGYVFEKVLKIIENDHDY